MTAGGGGAGSFLFNFQKSLPLCLLSSMASDDDFDMSRYSSSGYSSAEVRPLLTLDTPLLLGEGIGPMPSHTDGSYEQSWAEALWEQWGLNGVRPGMAESEKR